jgi:hypothetical protein
MKRFLLPVLISVVTLHTSVRAQVIDTDYDVDPAATHSTDGSPATTDGPELDKDVLDILTRMTEFISGASAFTIVADMANEVLQKDGQTLEFGTNITASLRRPSQANVHFDNRDGNSVTIILDGDTISVFSTIGNAHVYDTTRQPGDIDASFVFLAEQLGTPDQLNHFFSIDLTDSMKRMVKSGYYVGEATIAGILCHNLALSNEDEDVQLWVAKGDKPVPRRIVVTYKNLEGQPQFRAQFEEWNFSPNLSETNFSYSPPAHADRIDFFQDPSVDELE